jgi:RNase P subunit RPR2
MRKQYLHLSAYACDLCAGPVIAGAVAVRENEISKETDIRQVGAMCLSCGHRQSGPTERGRTRHLLPIEWDPASASGAGHLTTA